jgi:hypothetical protein
MQFHFTSDKPYLRHDYRVHYTNRKPVVFDNYEDVQLTWFETPKQFLNYIEVLDHKETKMTKGKGFT